MACRFVKPPEGITQRALGRTHHRRALSALSAPSSGHRRALRSPSSGGFQLCMSPAAHMHRLLALRVSLL
eukprot:CAMPEP_0174710346 /NCGR_PEP_ID=MMETSP1094-20130205/12007_1 /TAXON_ID=156173 /ORGANISM="Chrysochromulina brevifilum, Strain UTEX LB 985" /LENGTH=69 /DNA_ID=CAMNT_0015909141 /DNA_START=503 /DNA_END=712 /DNA_ORIENTATION=-